MQLLNNSSPLNNNYHKSRCVFFHILLSVFVQLQKKTLFKFIITNTKWNIDFKGTIIFVSLNNSSNDCQKFEYCIEKNISKIIFSLSDKTITIHIFLFISCSIMNAGNLRKCILFIRKEFCFNETHVWQHNKTCA